MVILVTLAQMEGTLRVVIIEAPVLVAQMEMVLLEILMAVMLVAFMEVAAEHIIILEKMGLDS